jgi:hypothetical protein
MQAVHELGTLGDFQSTQSLHHCSRSVRSLATLSKSELEITICHHTTSHSMSNRLMQAVQASMLKGIARRNVDRVHWTKLGFSDFELLDRIHHNLHVLDFLEPLQFSLAAYQLSALALKPTAWQAR